MAFRGPKPPKNRLAIVGVTVFLALWGGLAQGLAAAPPGRTVVVGDLPALLGALRSGRAEVVLLKGKNWGEFRLDGIRPERPIMIRSENPKQPAVINYIDLRNSARLRFSEIEVNVQPRRVGFAVRNASDLRFIAMDFHGHGDVTTAGSGLSLIDSPGVTISQSTFRALRGGVSHIRSNGLKVLDNRMSDLGSDGVLGTASDDVVISGNRFTNFRPLPKVHPDVIQFWTAKDRPTRNITITNNVFLRGEGEKVQGIFIANEGRTGYENVQIVGNAIVGGTFHGITLAGARNSRIEDNLVLGFKDMVARIMVKNSSRIVLRNNRATAYVLSGNTETTEKGNATIRQPSVGDVSTFQGWQKGRDLAATDKGDRD